MKMSALRPMKPIQCCNNCRERSVGCHAVCEKYIAETNERNEFLEKRRKFLEEEQVFYGYATPLRTKQIRRQRPKG